MHFISPFLQLRMHATRFGARYLRRGLRLYENSHQANSGGYAGSRGNSRLRGMPLTRDAATNATRNLALMTFAKVTLIPLTSIMKPGPTVIVRSVRQIGQLGGADCGGAMLQDPTLAIFGDGRARERCAHRMRATHLLLTLHHSRSLITPHCCLSQQSAPKCT